jgi:uncharacterized protein YndB with AHSA1/START domain
MTSTKHAAVLTLPADDQIHVMREFDAPRHLVYRAWTTPELVRQWWGAERGGVDSVEIDLRVGGRWRYVMTANGGQEVAFHGEYRELVPNERIVSTEVYEMPGVPADQWPGTVNTVTFAERDGRTTLTILTQCPDRAVRDAIIASGMEGGMQESLAALEQVARSLS